MQKAIAQNRWAHDALQHMSGIILQKISCWLAVIKMCNAGPVKTVRICLSKTLPAQHKAAMSEAGDVKTIAGKALRMLVDSLARSQQGTSTVLPAIH